jgi:hypothetical protein
MKRAHQVIEEGAPHGRAKGCQVWDEGCHLSHIKQVSIQKIGRKRARHLSLLWAATSRVRHLSKRGALLHVHMFKTKYSIINQPSIKPSLFPLTLSLTFVPLFHLKHVPTCSFIFALADFY